MGPDRPPHGRTLLRVDWQPGSDRLQGTCHCGAAHVADGPAEVWDWLLGHTTDHHTTADHHTAGHTIHLAAARPNGVTR